jgi:hypothetical protein
MSTGTGGSVLASAQGGGDRTKKEENEVTGHVLSKQIPFLLRLKPLRQHERKLIR